MVEKRWGGPDQQSFEGRADLGRISQQLVLVHVPRCLFERATTTISQSHLLGFLVLLGFTTKLISFQSHEIPTWGGPTGGIYNSMIPTFPAENKGGCKESSVTVDILPKKYVCYGRLWHYKIHKL